MKDNKIVKIVLKTPCLRKKTGKVNVNVCACSLIEATFYFFCFNQNLGRLCTRANTLSCSTKKCYWNNSMKVYSLVNLGFKA